MAKIARLFVLDDQDNRVGVFVVDMDALISMYQQRTEDGAGAQVIPQEWQEAQNHPSSVPLPAPLENWQWYHDHEGNLCLRFKRQE